MQCRAGPVSELREGHALLAEARPRTAHRMAVQECLPVKRMGS